MSTHNIGFYANLTKIIFELSSNMQLISSAGCRFSLHMIQPAHLHRLISDHKCLYCTVKPVLSNHIKQYIFLAFQTGGCLLLHESSAESSCLSFLHCFHSALLYT